MKTYQQFKNQRLVENMPNLPDAPDQQFSAPSQEDQYRRRTMIAQVQNEFGVIIRSAAEGKYVASTLNQALQNLEKMLTELNNSNGEWDSI